MVETVPCMFEPRRKDPSVFSLLLASNPALGTVTILLLFLVPLAIIFYPQIRDIQRRKYIRPGGQRSKIKRRYNK